MPRTKTTPTPETTTDTETVRDAFSYDVFFTEPDGFGAHMQVHAVSAESLVAGRTSLLQALKTIGATPRWQDEKRTPTAQNTRGSTEQISPMEKAASETFGAYQDLPVKNCPVDGREMKLVRNIDRKVGKNGKVWSDFYSCDTRTGGCGKIVNVKARE